MAIRLSFTLLIRKLRALVKPSMSPLLFALRTWVIPKSLALMVKPMALLM